MGSLTLQLPELNTFVRLLAYNVSDVCEMATCSQTPMKSHLTVAFSNDSFGTNCAHEKKLNDLKKVCIISHKIHGESLNNLPIFQGGLEAFILMCYVNLSTEYLFVE